MLIYQKNNFPKAPGGNCYHWKDAEIKIEIPKTIVPVPSGNDYELGFIYRRILGEWVGYYRQAKKAYNEYAGSVLG